MCRISIPLCKKQSIDISRFEITRDLYNQAKRAGVESINIDLIYGLPNQTIKGFTSTIEKIVQLRPSRIALYGYAHVTWLKNLQKVLERSHLPTPTERIALFTRAFRILAEQGYEYIGMDHFALPEDSLSKAFHNSKLNRNFMGYSTHKGAHVIGLGVSSISSLPTGYAQNLKEVRDYQEQINSGIIPIFRGI